ncbi:wd repeat-containing protein [Ophiostoma piceae UAMH 11346]|uniref:Wd repeat-containing protein n=1 Tax=Ophiostoma piceae (strain UAMH 11346) TaxID=1262450 RepID=S3CP36_OPHP1|nr:wd repeat-containing protein [Ophiostoma piceae UAMH 11346]
MEIDGSELAIRQDKGLSSSATLSPQTQTPPAPPPDGSPSPPTVTLVAADELREHQPWKPSPFHPGPSFKSLEWSADGTTVIAATTSKTILSYVLPTDLLDPRRHDDAISTTSTPQPPHCHYNHHSIKPQGHLEFGTTPLSFAAAPYFSLSTPWTQTVLVGCPDKPLQLFPLFPGNEDGVSSDATTTPSPIATYSLIKHETEAYMAPFALSWTAPGSHFVVGTNNLLALFDISRTSNDPPILRVPTTASLYAGALYGLGVSGNVSALAATPAHSLTAAGTWTRGVGLYDLARAGDLASHWNLRDNRDSDSGVSYDGGGVVQLLWSPCGRYLVVNERKSNGLLVYDVRGTHRLLATLSGRSNKTARPIRCTVYGSGASASGDSDDTTFELWSGTDDGSVVMYESVGKQEGAVEPTFSDACKWFRTGNMRDIATG